MNPVEAPTYTADGIDLVGYHDLDGRPGFKLALQTVGDRWYLFVTHFWESLLSVIDVTDPAAMELVTTIQGFERSATWQVQVADGLLVEGIEHRPEAWGGDVDNPGDEGIRFWDVSDPRSPELLGHWRSGARGVHRNHYDGGRYVHVAASKQGYEGNIYVVLDIEDPRHPVEVGRWFLPEQFVAGGASPARRISLHGPPYVVGDRAYLSYGAAGVVILDVSDVTAPQLVSRLDIGAAFSSRIAMHTAVPVPERQLLLVNTEAIAEMSEEPYNFAGIVDIQDERDPRLISLMPIPVPGPDAAYPNFSRRGGRFGPHNQHHPQRSADLFQLRPHRLHDVVQRGRTRLRHQRPLRPAGDRLVPAGRPEGAPRPAAEDAGDPVRGHPRRRPRHHLRHRQEPRAPRPPDGRPADRADLT